MELKNEEKFSGFSKSIEQLDKQDVELSNNVDLVYKELSKIEDSIKSFDVSEQIKELKSDIENIQLIKGDKGDDYVLTADDKAEISKLVKVPVIERVVEKTEVIREVPIITNEIKEVAKYENAEQIVEKINTLENVIERKTIKGLDNLVDQPHLDRAIDILDRRTQYLINKTTVAPSATTWASITGTQTDVNVGGFTNDVGYLTSADLTGYVPNTRTLTINGTAFDLSADRSWSVGTVTSVAALTLGTTGTDLSSSVANGTTTPVITLNVPTASALNRGALSSADWGTFNSKESALTFSIGLTRVTDTITANLSTGVSGGQTAIGGTASGNNLTLSSTSNATKGKILFGTSAYDEVNNRLGIGTTAPGFPLMVSGTANVTGTLYVNNNGSGNGVGSVGTIQLGDSTISKSYGGGFIFNGGAALINGWNISGTGSLTNGGVVTSGYLLGSELRVGSGGSNGKITTDGNKILTFYNNTAGAERMRIDLSGNVGIGQSTPTATLHLRAGTASASTAPLKLASGTSLTTAESGAVEFTTDNLYFTITTGAARKNVTLDEGLTSGRVPFATTNGRLTDDADMTFATDTLTVTKLVGTTNIKVGTVAGYISSDGSTGATGIFTTVDLKTVTVKDGIITSIV